MNRRRVLVFGAASGVVGVGLVAMTVAGAPQGLAGLQGVVAGVALVVAAVASVRLPRVSDRVARIVCLLALTLMALPFLFSGIHGVHRWIALGPIQLQPAAMALPLVAVFAAREPDDRLAAAALLIAGGIAALQPDLQAALGVAAVALCMVVLVRPAKLWWVAVGVSLVMVVISAFGAPLEPVPYVELVLPRAFEAHWGLGLLVAVAMAAVPLLMVAASPERRPVQLVLTALWGALVAGCLAGTFPTPVVGYGLSWVIGFALSLGMVARRG